MACNIGVSFRQFGNPAEGKLSLGFTLHLGGTYLHVFLLLFPSTYTFPLAMEQYPHKAQSQKYVKMHCNLLNHHSSAEP